MNFGKSAIGCTLTHALGILMIGSISISWPKKNIKPEIEVARMKKHIIVLCFMIGSVSGWYSSSKTQYQ